MAFILPTTYMLILHGSLFNLTDYDFKNSRVYNDLAIEPFKQVNRINELIAEYRLVETQAEFREFVGIDVASNLKVLVNQYPYSFYDQLSNRVEPNSNKVQIALKVVLKTVNETVPFDAPQIRYRKIQRYYGHLLERFITLPSKYGSTHYVKSIVYGYEAFQVIYVEARNSRQKADLTEALITSVGRTGTLDETFHEKFWEVLEKHYVVSYGNQAAFGFFFPPSHHPPLWGIEDMILFKSTLENIMETNDRGDPLYYEMQPLSLISPSIPLVEIHSGIFNQLNDVEKKYEDVRIAINEFSKLSFAVSEYNLTVEQEIQLQSFANGLLDVANGFKKAILTLDISTSGSIDQFSEAMASYGNTNDTNKYRRKMKRFRKKFSSNFAATAPLQ